MKTQKEIEKYAEKYADGYSLDEAHTSYISFIDGYTKCQQDNTDKKYTEEDLKKAYYRMETKFKSIPFEDFIQSLNKIK